MKRTLSASFLALAVTFSGCQAPGDNSAQIQQLETRVAALEKKLSEISSATPSVSEVPSSSATQTPAGEVTPSVGGTPAQNSDSTASSDLWKTLNYDDLPSPEILKEIVSLGFLPKVGVTDQKGFSGDLTRGQYVALLVEMNNLMHEPNNQIRLAREGSGQAFEDVPPSHPYYKYIQGMVDAGYVIGFNEKSFQPDKPLTREEMVAIAAKRDLNFDGFDAAYYWENYTPFTDKNDIAPKYRESVSKDFGEGARSNLKQAFGELKLFHPKKNVKLYEALLSLQGVGDYSSYTYEQKTKEAMEKP